MHMTAHGVVITTVKVVITSCLRLVRRVYLRVTTCTVKLNLTYKQRTFILQHLKVGFAQLMNLKTPNRER